MMAAAELRRRRGRRTIVFVDEIHRFNKAQQDAFLPRVEAGDIVLIGATTENPSFEVNAALLSRSKVFVLQPLTEAALVGILERAIADEERGLGRERPEVTADALGALARAADGDARRALNLLQLAVAAAPQPVGHPRVDLALVQQTLQRKTLLYDKDGEEHFNLMSALHKSMRNSDPDASVYWLARMVEAGEDPMYVARRLVRFASEDVGNADPQALVVAVAAQRRRCISSACPKATRRWRRPCSTWPRRRRATPPTSPTARPPRRRSRTWPSRCRCTCATRRRG